MVHRATLSRAGAGAALACALACAGPPGEAREGPPCGARGPAVGWFREVPPAKSGLAFLYEPVDFKSGALAVADLDGDGRLDVLAGSRAGGAAAFRNLGRLRFARWAGAARLEEAGPVRAMAPVDLDRDGDLDLVVAGDEVLLYEQRGGALSRPVRIDDSAATEHVLAVDLDGDGLAELYLSNLDYRSEERSKNRLLHNRGGLALEAVAGAAGADGPAGLTWTATAFDVDGDGDLDLHAANDTLAADYGGIDPGEADRPVDALYLSRWADDGVLAFRDEAEAFGLAEPRSSMGGIVADLDRDGRLDLLVPDFGANDALVRGEDGVFRDAAAELGLDGPRREDGECAGSDDPSCLLLSWGAAVGDFDLDGLDDVVVVNGESFPGVAPPPAQVFRGPAPFEEVDAGLGCFEGGGLAAADLDGDGDLDLVVSTREGPLRLFENVAASAERPGAALRIRLVGSRSAPDGAGAEVDVVMAGGRVQRQVAGAGGVAFTAAAPELHVGTGGEEVARVIVRWPSGAVQEVDGPLEGLVTIAEAVP